MNCTYLRNLLLSIGFGIMLIGCGTTSSTSTGSTTTDTATSDNNTSTTITETLGYSDITLRSASTSTTITDFYTPETMSQRFEDDRNISWTQYSGNFINLKHISFGTNSDIVVLSDTNTSIDENLTISSGLVSNTTVTNDLLLDSMFELVELNASLNQYALYSIKHGNYAIDISADDNTTLVLNDIRSYAAYNTPANATLLTFNYSNGTLTANGRYVLDTSGDYNTTVHFESTSFTDKNVSINGSTLQLTSASNTSMKIYVAPIGLDIPSDMNPDSVTRVDNSEFYLTSAAKGDKFTDVSQGMSSAYTAQVTASGLNDATTAAASAMIDTIQTKLATQGSQTRYSKEFYLTLRAGLLSRILKTSEATDATLGQNTVPYVYFTNETDSDGNYHPFMVIDTYGIPDSIALLGDVPHPPGDGLAGQYATQGVTRSFHIENHVIMIPMRDYGEVASLTENDLDSVKSLAFDAGPNATTAYDHHNYASIGSSALAIDGIVIYPSYNNTLSFSQEFGELSVLGMHSGRGLGVHYHADPMSAALNHPSDTTDTGLTLYNKSDYTGHSHPPIISIGFDGIAGYGVYLPGDTTSDGVNVALDEFGGHDHDGYGYHYHAHTTSRVSATKVEPGPGGATTGGNTYTTHEFAPLGAWSGRINKVPFFLDKDAGRSTYAGYSN